MTASTETERFEAWYEENIGDENKPVREAAFSAWQAARRAPAVTVPQSIEQMAVDRYKVVPSHSSMFYPCAVVAGDGQQQLYIGRAVECQNMARKFTGAFLDGAFVALAAAPQSPEVVHAGAGNAQKSAETRMDTGLHRGAGDAPETAPAQMPEPVGVAFTFEIDEGGPVASQITSNPTLLPMGWSRLYTEQQVRQLLAAHGIGKDKQG